MTQFGALCQATAGGEATGSSATLNERGKRKLGLPALVGKIDTVVRQMKTQVLDRKVNPKPEQDTAPQTPQAPLKLPRAIVFGDEKVFG